MSTLSQSSIRVAIYTRKSTEENLEQDFNSLDAQREAALAYIGQRRHIGWVEVSESYDDGGYSGGNIDRPALQRLLCEIEAGKIDCVVVYKLDRISRSLLDFAKLMENFEQRGVAFVSVTQEFDSSTPVGRLTINILSSFSQFEREIISERIRDKKAASRQKGLYSGGIPPFGYTNDSVNRRLLINPVEAAVVRRIYADYLTCTSVKTLTRQLNAEHIPSKCHTTATGRQYLGERWSTTQVWNVLRNPLYLSKVRYKGDVYPGQHEPIIDPDTWEKAQAIVERTVRPVRAPRQTALLKGMIYCGNCGCMMRSSSCRDGVKSYRYYQCTTSHRQVTHDCPTYTIPADMVETAVIDFIKQIQHLPDPILNQCTLDDIPMARRQAGYELCAKLHQLQLWSIIEPDARQSAIRELLRDVTVYTDHLEMAFVGKASSNRQQQEVFNLIIPLEIKSSIRRHSANAPTRTPTPLQTALAQSHIWRRLLDNGQYPDIGKLAAVVKFDPSYVARTLNLTLLSPDLITEIIQGGLLADLPLSHLPKTWPLSWTEQQQVFSSLSERNCTAR